MHVRSRGLWILPRGDTKYHSSCRYVGHSHFRIYVQDGIGEHNKVETSSKTIFSHNNTRDGSKFTVQEASSSFKAKVLRFLLLDCHDSAHYVYDICSLDSDDRDHWNLLAVFLFIYNDVQHICWTLCSASLEFDSRYHGLLLSGRLTFVITLVCYHNRNFLLFLRRSRLNAFHWLVDEIFLSPVFFIRKLISSNHNI